MFLIKIESSFSKPPQRQTGRKRKQARINYEKKRSSVKTQRVLTILRLETTRQDISFSLLDLWEFQTTSVVVCNNCMNSFWKRKEIGSLSSAANDWFSMDQILSPISSLRRIWPSKLVECLNLARFSVRLMAVKYGSALFWLSGLCRIALISLYFFGVDFLVVPFRENQLKCCVVHICFWSRLVPWRNLLRLSPPREINFADNFGDKRNDELRRDQLFFGDNWIWSVEWIWWEIATIV